MRRIDRKKKNRGQTMLEYALVVGVIAMGVIVLGKHVFGKKDGLAHNLMKNAVQNASATITPPEK